VAAKAAAQGGARAAARAAEMVVVMVAAMVAARAAARAVATVAARAAAKAAAKAKVRVAARAAETVVVVRVVARGGDGRRRDGGCPLSHAASPGFYVRHTNCGRFACRLMSQRTSLQNHRSAETNIGSRAPVLVVNRAFQTDISRAMVLV
jgi:hypothetical protein